MVKLRSLDIVYGSSQGVYQAGDLVHGHVVIDCSEQLKLRSIVVECQGKTKVHWDKWMLRDNSRTYYECYRAEECYFNKEILLYGTGPGGTAIVHPSGRQIYPFEFTLPEELPSSFEGAHGYVRYFCKVTVERPWKFDQNVKKAFSVLSQLDLNREAAVRAPIQFDRQSPVNCCCCVSGSVSAKFHLDQRGYVPGQNILINAEVHNASNTTVTRSKVILCQHINFYALHQGLHSTGLNVSCLGKLKRHTTSRIVKCIMKGEVPPGQAERWDNEPLQVPSLPPSRLDGCKIIEIFYTLTFSVEPNWGGKVQISTEIIIGTVPLRQVIICPPSYSSALLDRRPSTPPPPFEAGHSAGYSSQCFAFMDDIPPPTYEESVFGIVEFQDEEENEPLRYTPMYTFYNWDQLTPTLFLSQSSLAQAEEASEAANDTNTLQVPQVTLPVSRLERYPDTYNDEECATITIQVPTLPNIVSRSTSTSRSPEVSSICSSNPGNTVVLEPPRQTISRNSTVDSDGGGSGKDMVMHNGHIILMAKESDASYQSHGSASDSLHLSEDLEMHLPLCEKRSDAASQDNSDSLQLFDDFDDTGLNDQNSQEAPLIDKSGKNCRDSPHSRESPAHSDHSKVHSRDDGKTRDVAEEQRPLVENAQEEEEEQSRAKGERQSPGKTAGCCAARVHAHAHTDSDLPKVHKDLKNGTM